MQQGALAAADEERAQLLEMVNSSTQALAATASRCDELKQQQQTLALQLQEEKGQRLLQQQQQQLQQQKQQQQQLQLQQQRDGLCAAAAAIVNLKKTLAEVQECMPAAVHEAQQQSAQDVYR